MANASKLEARWEKVPLAGTLDLAMADVMDNIAAVADVAGAEGFIRQNLMALVNVTRRATAQELYRRWADDAFAEIKEYDPGTIKQTLRWQREAAAALSKPSTGNSCSPGTTTKESDIPF